MTALCESYWYPVYAFLRRSGHGDDEARDLAQGFFTRLIEKRDLATADPQRGRFRAFLLGSVRHFVANERDRARAAKRGGGRAPLSIDFADAERRYALEPADPATPETLFMRQWALTVVNRAVARVEADYVARGRGVLFERLRPLLLVGEPGPGRREVAEGLDMSETALNVALHRVRRRLRRELKEEVAQTLVDAGDVDHELGQLMSALGA